MNFFKTLIILVLALVLVAVGWFTRPTESDFRGYVRHHMSTKADNLFSQATADSNADALLNQCTIRDRILWTEVAKDDQVIYIGALSHWFDRTLIERSDMSKAAY